MVVTITSPSGAHLAAMKQASSLTSEIRIHAFAADSLPAWKEAKAQVAEKGRVFRY